ncbi:hypothetical protein [Halobacillus litoralis]|uniref:hypothetical protein n=1 Tax=Halobacillus litoralis TaxID=45668 RepID=UPI00136D0F5D|nr:hypothetical protein [Halobacillus litoralis]
MKNSLYYNQQKGVNQVKTVEHTLKSLNGFRSLCWSCKRELLEEEVVLKQDAHVSIPLCFDCYNMAGNDFAE